MANYMKHIKPIDLNEGTLRLLNLGETIVISATDGKETDAMAAAWCCNLDMNPTKLTVVLDKTHKTREILERQPKGEFIIQIPNVKTAPVAFALGSVSAHDDPEKLEHCGAKFFDPEGLGRPFLKGCNAWIVCRLIPEPQNQKKYDLFIAEAVAAWADDRVFDGRHWHFRKAGRAWRTIHYVQGGRFYMIGRGFDL